MKPSEDAVVETIDIAAPPERVFRALTTPEELLAWWGSPDTYRCETWELDLVVGGRWKSTGAGGEGRRFEVGGEFRAIEPPRLLAFTWEPSWVEVPTTEVRIELQPTAGGTRVVWTHSGFSGYPEALRDHGSGLPSVVAWLKDHAETAREEAPA
jgi:uncharacterized protein YndB with AHSA1/START domain